jgi:alpha-L-rhamnosidase
MNKREEPGFGRWIELGSTTTREHWDEGGSHNHPMLGGGLVWFYRNLAGMKADADQPGYKHIIFRPQPIEELEFVTYSNLTPYGTSGITWKNQNGIFTMDITVPVGCEATVYLPSVNQEKITENGLELAKSNGIHIAGADDQYTRVICEKWCL